MTEDFKNVSEVICNFTSFIDEIKNSYDYIQGEIKNMDKLTQDYLHKLELEQSTYKDRSKIATKLKECRIKRRKYKDTIDIIESIYQWSVKNENAKTINQLKESLGMVRKQESLKPNRIYTYKILQGQIRKE